MLSLLVFYCLCTQPLESSECQVMTCECKCGAVVSLRLGMNVKRVSINDTVVEADSGYCAYGHIEIGISLNIGLLGEFGQVSLILFMNLSVLE